jgi:hypothetical protein
MNKLAMAALAVATLTSASILPAIAQRLQCTANYCGENGSHEPDCGDQLGHLKRVYPAEVLGVDNHHRVWVTEFCPTSDLMRSDGNAAYLRTAIARNDVLVDILGDKGYHADDVFAVKMMGDETISLYVHRFDD